MIIQNVNTEQYYLVDDLTGYTLLDGAQEEPFYAKPCDKDGNVTQDEYVELKQLKSYDWERLDGEDEVDE